MRKIIPLIALLVIGVAVYFVIFNKKKATVAEPKQESIVLKKHSEEFNKSTDSIVNAYLEIKTAFVNTDTVAAKAATRNFIVLIDRMPIDELKKDKATIFETVQGNISDIKSNAASLLQQTDITEMRKDFSAVSDMMYPSFFTAINYEGPKLYLQNCPMAFNDSISANWISNMVQIENPYMGKNHPTYHSGMLACGSVKDSIVAK